MEDKKACKDDVKSLLMKRKASLDFFYHDSGGNYKNARLVGKN